MWGANEVGRFIVTGATNAAGKPSQFYCRICRKDVSVLTHGPHEVLRHFQGVKHFACDQRLKLETPGWRVLDFEGNPFSESELERRRELILRGPLVIRDREYPFAENLIVDDSGAPDATLPVLAKVSSLIEVLQLGGPYELVHQLWSQFTLTASRVNIDVTWSRDEVLIGNFLFYVFHIYMHRLIGAVIQSTILNGMYPSSFLVCSVGWRRMGSAALSLRSATQRFGCWCGHGKGPHFAVFVLRCWADSAPILPWSPLICATFWMLLVQMHLLSLHGGPHVLAEASASYLGSGYRARLVEYPTFDLRLLKRCLRRTAASVFGSLDPFSTAEFVINRLKGAETRDWMASRPALRKAIIMNDLSMPGLVDVVANIVGVWRLVVLYVKKTGRKDDGDSLVVRSSTVGVLLHHMNVFITSLLFRRRGWTGICTTINLFAWNSGCFISF